MEKISVVIPCYNDEAVLMKIYKDLGKVLKSLPTSYELIFIDNGSRDHTLSILRKIAEEDYNCNYLSLSKNVSKMEAVFLGAKLSTGKYIVFIDCYHPASLVLSFYEALQQHCHFVGGEVVNNPTKKSGKRQPYFKMAYANIFKDVLQTDNLTAFCDRFYNHTYIYWIQYKELEHVESRWENTFISFQKKTCNSMIIFPCVIILCFIILPMLLVSYYEFNIIYACLLSFIIGIVILFMMKKYKQKLDFHGQDNIKESTFYNK